MKNVKITLEIEGKEETRYLTIGTDLEIFEFRQELDKFIRANKIWED